MNGASICRFVGGALVALVGVAVGAGGFQLWRVGAEAWPDVIATRETVQRTAGGMLAMALVLVVAGVAAATKMPWGREAGMVATIAVVLAAFWVNHVLFGNIRPAHTVTNIVVAAIILALLWFG
jgi:hypothetical protein